MSLADLSMHVPPVFIFHWLARFVLMATTTGFLNIYAQEVQDSDGQKLTTITAVGHGCWQGLKVAEKMENVRAWIEF